MHRSSSAKASSRIMLWGAFPHRTRKGSLSPIPACRNRMDRETQGHSWRVVASSVAGISHARSGDECQDAHCWVRTGNGMIIAAVADGAGSAAMGGLGAEVAVRTAVERLAERGDDLIDVGDRSLRLH